MKAVCVWLTDRLDLQLHVYQLKTLIKIVKVIPTQTFSACIFNSCCKKSIKEQFLSKTTLKFVFWGFCLYFAEVLPWLQAAGCSRQHLKQQEPWDHLQPTHYRGGHSRSVCRRWTPGHQHERQRWRGGLMSVHHHRICHHLDQFRCFT